MECSSLFFRIVRQMYEFKYSNRLTLHTLHRACVTKQRGSRRSLNPGDEPGPTSTTFKNMCLYMIEWKTCYRPGHHQCHPLTRALLKYGNCFSCALQAHVSPASFFQFQY